MSEYRSAARLLRSLWKFPALFVLVALTLHASSAQELVSNPGFESGTNGWFGLAGAGVSVVAGGHSGASCAGVVLPAGTGLGIGQTISGKLSPGQTYTWSAWLRVSPAVPPPSRSVVLNLYYTDTGTNYVRPIAFATLTTTWTQVAASFDFATLNTPTNVMIAFDGFSPGSGFSFFVDDVSVTNSSPVLTMQQTNGVVVISWPTSAAAYVLQSKASLAVNTWSTVSGTVQTNGNRLTLTLSPSSATRYYRLRK